MADSVFLYNSSLAREQVDDVEDGQVDEEHVEGRPHPRPDDRGSWVGISQLQC